MKKKFNIVAALVCAVVLMFAGCSDVVDTISEWLDSISQALKEALGLIDTSHTLIDDSEPVLLTDGAEYIFQVINNGDYSNENQGKYIYYTANGTALASELDSGNEAYYWTVEKDAESTYTFRLKNTSSSTPMYMANTYSATQMDLTDNVEDAAEMQMWTWGEGTSGYAVNIIVLTNKKINTDYNNMETKTTDDLEKEAAGETIDGKNDPIAEGDTAAYNAYLYPAGSLTNIHWWGAATNEELTNVLAVTYTPVGAASAE